MVTPSMAIESLGGFIGRKVDAVPTYLPRSLCLEGLQAPQIKETPRDGLPEAVKNGSVGYRSHAFYFLYLSNTSPASIRLPLKHML